MNKYIVLSLFSILIISLFFLNEGLKVKESYTEPTYVQQQIQGVAMGLSIGLAPLGKKLQTDMSNINGFHPTDPAYSGNLISYYQLVSLQNVLQDKGTATFIANLAAGLAPAISTLETVLSQQHVSSIKTLVQSNTLATSLSTSILPLVNSTVNNIACYINPSSSNSCNGLSKPYSQ